MKNYAKAEARADAVRDALFSKADEAVTDERRERYAGAVRIERGPGAFRITFPQLAEHERGSAQAKAAWDRAKAPMADVKAIMGRTFSKVEAAWIVPIDQATSVEILAEEYGATIETATDERDRIIAELERQIEELTAELTLAYAHDCRTAVAA